MPLINQSRLAENTLCGVTSPCIAFRDILKELTVLLMEVGQSEQSNFERLLPFIDLNLPLTSSLMKLPVYLLQFWTEHYGPDLARRMLEPDSQFDFNKQMFNRA